MPKNTNQKKTNKPGLQNAKTDSGRMKILLAMQYKGHWIYVRRIDEELFFWDAVFDGQLYSNYVVITRKKGEDISEDVVAQAREMCYAGAAATIDTKLGVELSKEDKENVEMFEGSKKNIKEKIK